MSTGNAACDACVTKSCCTVVRNCVNDAQCKGLDGCLENCAQGDDACQNSCTQSFPNGLTPLQNVATCLQQNCPGTC